MSADSATDQPLRTRPRRSLGAVLLEFLGSMNLAITLLAAVAIASVIGTVLQQNQPYNDYVIKFGPFWFEVFGKLQLYDVYHAPWFLFMLAFLVVSTATCIYRNAPNMVREMRQWREHVAEKSLRGFKLSDDWETAHGRDRAADLAEALVRARGYATRRHAAADHTVIAAKRGTANRIGYLITHAAIVVICIGGLLDGNLPLVVAEKLGRVVVEKRNVSVKDVNPESFLSADNASFRGTITIPEGQQADFLFLNVRDGYLVQRLPFSVEVKDFRIEHYDTGQPKSFESDLVIHDDDLPQPLEQTISVNHPLTYKGVTIYQASFGDGGSELKTRAWPLDGGEPFALEGRVNGTTAVKNAERSFDVEFTDFRKFNIHNLADAGSKPEFHNVGPSFQYKLRYPDGRAREYNNYMSPIEVEGRYFLLSGVRTTPNEDFRYLHIPVGPDGTIDRFMDLLGRLHDDKQVLKASEAIADLTLSVKPDAPAGMREQVINKTMELARLFVSGGMGALQQAVVDAFPKEKREEGFNAYLNILRVVSLSLYEQTLSKEGVNLDNGLSQADDQFFQDAMTAMSGLPSYDAPLLLQLTDFNYIQASGLEMTRSPGKYVVYLGCALLIAGVFMLFYIHQRRLWIYLKDTAAGTEILFAGSDTRKSPDFAREFATMQSGLASKLGREE